MNDVKDFVIEEGLEVTEEVVNTGLTTKQKLVGVGIGVAVASAVVAGGVLLYKKVIKPRVDAAKAKKQEEAAVEVEAE